MSMAQSRLELTIDIFEERNRRALILPQLSPRELIESILQEFRSLAYLGDTPAAYTLVRKGDREALKPDVPLAQQLRSGERLTLVEDAPPVPSGAQRPSRHAYLRDEATGKVYKLHWVPAIIGRPDSGQGNNELLAVDLSAHPHGLRVSRRHAQITEANGRFWVESLSQNATSLGDAKGRESVPVDRKLPLESGQSIRLDQSQIVFRFLVRGEEPAV